MRLGGVDQWVMIRGEDIANPLLVLVHGGPGFPEMRLFRSFNAALEKVFTVVYWEQRGTDKSFDPRISPSTMTVERFLADLDELVDRVRQRFGKDQVVIFGHSWGSALGLLYAARHPAKVAAYVGSGQVSDWPASERASYAFVVAEAERRNDRRALRKLRALGPPPYTAEQIQVQRRWLTKYVGFVRGMSFVKVCRVLLGGPEASVLDLPNIIRGAIFSLRAMWPEVSTLNLVEQVPELRVPVFFCLGRHDHVVDPDLAAAYFERLEAPRKELLWFEDSAHEPSVEEADKFNAVMTELVRPLAA